MQVRTALLFSVLALGACTPRQPPPRPAPAPPPPPVAVTPEEEAAAVRRRAETAFDRGISLARQSRWGEAAEAYRQSTELQPREPRYHMALAEALLQGGREGEAADALQAGIRAEEALPRPNHRVLAVDYERLIRLLTRLNRLDEARVAQDRQNQHRRARDQAPPR
ncbi:MAG TPA: tetratricopeptide repeat protein [Longimicrobium sp.]|uniref:tetratricopeptide repeat protein n=1 Tax=Longimicrobium sp. TaxID=2029185 RepID=UPI002EDBA95B